MASALSHRPFTWRIPVSHHRNYCADAYESVWHERPADSGVDVDGLCADFDSGTDSPTPQPAGSDALEMLLAAESQTVADIMEFNRTWSAAC
ncbi:hypothetical protein HQO84_01410 [Rhodococcus fascians]|nr:hypothetical protein [Rhodococcus fascians]MBY3995250.1 hypothetical protein [Rhodococcus fascians]MBY4000430.1 hypothetical protein [Rhodococcus fascians]MBY4005458.1 hypothetical protein [Rhodococcus fascians]MBY4016291.1 hypothetical protein [Rhodococcus fascians]